MFPTCCSAPDTSGGDRGLRSEGLRCLWGPRGACHCGPSSTARLREHGGEGLGRGFNRAGLLPWTKDSPGKARKPVTGQEGSRRPPTRIRRPASAKRPRGWVEGPRRRLFPSRLRVRRPVARYLQGPWEADAWKAGVKHPLPSRGGGNLRTQPVLTWFLAS